jgi:hypothetical protein
MPLGGPCPGRCNSAYRKAREAFTEALALYDPLDPNQQRPLPPEIQPWPGDPHWCGRCTSVIREQLHELDYIGCMLAAEADGLRGQNLDQRVTGSQEHPSPSPGADDLDELVTVLTGWEEAYRDLMGWPSPPRRGFLAAVITTTTAWLMGHLDGILAHPDIAADFGAEVMQWHREFTGKTKAGVRRLRKPLRCPGCRLLMLTWTEGEKYVRCGNPDCNRVLLLAEYEVEVARRAGQGGHETSAA